MLTENKGKYMLYRLSELRSGTRGVIQEFEENESKIKLMEMGCIPGESVLIENIAPLGDPIAIQIAGYSLSLRKENARYIWIKLSELNTPKVENKAVL